MSHVQWYISLLVKVFNDSTSIRDITPTIQVTLETLNGHALAALIPDYNFTEHHPGYILKFQGIQDIFHGCSSLLLLKDMQRFEQEGKCN